MGVSWFRYNLLPLVILIFVKGNYRTTTLWLQSLRMKPSVCILFISVHLCHTANWSSTRSFLRMTPFISARHRTSRVQSSPWRGWLWWCLRIDRALPGTSKLTPCRAPLSFWLGTGLCITLIKLLLTQCTTWRLKVSGVWTNKIEQGSYFHYLFVA